MTSAVLLSEVAQLGNSLKNRSLAQAAGLTITQVAWEDTSRHKNSCWGSNISDLTLNTSDTRMPMIRKPNFSDVTGDLDISHLTVTVGNELDVSTSVLRRIPLSEYLRDLDKYVGGPAANSMMTPRDEVVLCSSQACILPLPAEGEVEFVPELFNYQSTEDNPAVLAIVATAQGTSAHVVTQREQKLYFNRNGQATKYLAKRLSQDRAERKVDDAGEMTTEEQDRNVLVIYQIPLKKGPLAKLYVESMTGKKTAIDVNSDETLRTLYYKIRHIENVPVTDMRLVCGGQQLDEMSPNQKLTELNISNGDTVHMLLKLRGGGGSRGAPSRGLASVGGGNYVNTSLATAGSAPIVAGGGGLLRGAAPTRGMEHAMLRSADKSEGAFKINSRVLERDDRYPIRATFQFYRVTDEANIGKELFTDISAKIESVYDMAKDKGSLVIDSSARKTEMESLPEMAAIPTDANPLFSAFKLLLTL